MLMGNKKSYIIALGIKKEGVCMAEAIVFNGLNSLDFLDVRTNVCRIPEVIQRIRQAQNYLDLHTDFELDLMNFIGSDDRTFLNHIRYKSLAASIVQVGLYDRYRKFNQEPDFFMGNVNGDSALQVACGVISFTSMLRKSPVFGEELYGEEGLRHRQPVSLQAGSDPVLSGFSLTEYAVFSKMKSSDEAGEAESFGKMDIEKMSISKMIHQLVEEESVDKIINIGPGNLLVTRTGDDLILDQIAILESIDLDPMLNWFWPSLKDSHDLAS